MNTRSQTKSAIIGCLNKINNNSSYKEDMKREKTIQLSVYSVDMNFDEASLEWHRNKKRIGHKYIYICLETNSDKNSDKNNICGKKCYHYDTTCYIHRNRKL
jgi:hypothetical protein